MRLLILFNPVAGRGRARAAAAAVRQQLESRGHEATVRETRPEPLPIAGETGASGGADPLAADPEAGTLETGVAVGGESRGANPKAAIPGAGDTNVAGDASIDGLIVVGGDGTMRLAAPLAMRLGAPVALFPFGTENLFARQYGMERNVQTIVSLVTGGRSRAVDVGVVNGEVFLMMVSIGLDAEVVHDLAARRRGPISHASYIMPILRAAWGWRPTRLAVTVDGSPLDLTAPGMLVIANTRQYAGRLDPASTAVDDDGLLDVVYIPVGGRWGVVRRVIQCWRRRLLEAKGVTHARGRAIRVEAEEPVPFQIDGDPALSGRGDAAGRTVPLTTPLKIDVRPGALRVFCPPSAALSRHSPSSSQAFKGPIERQPRGSCARLGGGVPG